LTDFGAMEQCGGLPGAEASDRSCRHRSRRRKAHLRRRIQARRGSLFSKTTNCTSRKGFEVLVEPFVQRGLPDSEFFCRQFSVCPSSARIAVLTRETCSRTPSGSGNGGSWSSIFPATGIFSKALFSPEMPSRPVGVNEVGAGSRRALVWCCR